jgi:hypothetical protein
MMPDTWTTVFESSIAGRSVKGEVYSEGGFRVLTTQVEDEPGSLQHDNDESTRLHAQTLIISPTPAGAMIVLEGDTFADLRQQLIDNGFSDAAADEIIAKYRT